MGKSKRENIKGNWRGRCEDKKKKKGKRVRVKWSKNESRNKKCEKYRKKGNEYCQIEIRKREREEEKVNGDFF